MRSLEMRNIVWKSEDDIVPSTGERLRSEGVRAREEKKAAVAGVSSNSVVRPSSRSDAKGLKPWFIRRREIGATVLRPPSRCDCSRWRWFLVINNCSISA